MNVSCPKNTFTVSTLCLLLTDANLVPALRNAKQTKHKTVMQNFTKHQKTSYKFSGQSIVTCSEFHTEIPQILVATVQDLVAMTTWRLEFVHH
jgi:hypothetical protein